MRNGQSGKTPATEANEAWPSSLGPCNLLLTNRTKTAMNIEGCTPKIALALTTPTLNRGVGFTHEQRRKLGLTGRLPSGVLTLDQQAERVWRQLQSMPTDLARNVPLDQLHYRHEILYFKVPAAHLTELMPVVYTPTVGEAIQRFSDEFRQSTEMPRRLRRELT